MRVSDRNDNNKAVQRNHPIKHIKKIDHLFPPSKTKHTVDCDALTNGYERRPTHQGRGLGHGDAEALASAGALSSEKLFQRPIHEARSLPLAACCDG